MNVKVVYHSETGNTKKIALAIADDLGIPAEEITDEIKIENVDVLFVGGFLKAFTLVKPVKKLLKSIDSPAMAKCIAVFSTSASGKGILKYAKKYIKNDGIIVCDEDFKCLGAYMKSNAGHPDVKDCEAAKAFAQKTAKNFTLKSK